MARLAWYKRYPKDFREGTRRLSFEERGFYSDVLDLIYEHGNELPDDDSANAHMLHADVRTYRRLKARLMDVHKKLYVAHGMLRNSRADAEAAAVSSRRSGGKPPGAPATYSPELRQQCLPKSGPESGKFNGIPVSSAQLDSRARARQNPDKTDKTEIESLLPPPESRDSRAGAREEVGGDENARAAVAELVAHLAPRGYYDHQVAKAVEGWLALAPSWWVLHKVRTAAAEKTIQWPLQWLAKQVELRVDEEARRAAGHGPNELPESTIAEIEARMAYVAEAIRQEQLATMEAKGNA
jgi:uncharacterized protein YdaU (DUF1376 family)